MVNYPYDDGPQGTTAYSKSPDDDVFKMVSLAYSQVILGDLGLCGGNLTRLWLLFDLFHNHLQMALD